MIDLPNALIIVGTDRNAGKTTLAENIIRQFSRSKKIIGLKISPHFHELEKGDEVFLRNEQFLIVRETRPDTGKDSSRMLKAGASEVYYIQVWDQNIRAAVNYLLDKIEGNPPMVCESGWLRNIVNPGIFLIVNRKGNQLFKGSIREYRPLADRWVEFDGKDFNFKPEELQFEKGRWAINQP
jgi:hypothetical protein